MSEVILVMKQYERGSKKKDTGHYEERMMALLEEYGEER